MNRIGWGGMMVVASVAAGFLIPPPCGANGRDVVIKRLSGTLGASGGGQVELEAAIDPVIFAMTAVQEKYRVLRVKVQNHGSTALHLSPTRDHAEVEVSDRRVPVILDLATHDPAVWDRLPADVRAAMAYPTTVEGGEEESVVMFIPDLTIDAPPEVIHYSIDGQAEAVLKEKRTVKA